MFDAILERRESIRAETSLDLKTADVTGNEIVDYYDIVEMQDFIVHRISNFSGTIKKAFNSVDRTIVDKTLSGNKIPDAETYLTSEIAKLADDLETYDKVFEYVLNNVNTEFYYGSRKGAIGTYEQNGGNDYDQACLMIAMLNYLGYDADFAVCEVVYTEKDLINMTSASDIYAAVNIFTSQGKQVLKYKTDGYSTKQVLVHLKLDDEDLYYNPSFKYYTPKKEFVIFENKISELTKKYDLSDDNLNLYDISDEITNKYGTIDISNVFPKYEIVHQDVNKTLPYIVISDGFEFYDVLPDEKCDFIELSVGDVTFNEKYSHLYNKNMTIKYELDEYIAKYLIDAYGHYGFDGTIGSLTETLQSIAGYVNIHAIVKLDGTPVLKGIDSKLGETERLKINFRSANVTYSIEKELTYGALYNIVFDSQVISTHDIAENYSKLPKTFSEQSELKALKPSSVYGSEYLMDTMNLIGKVYFSQVDTNNAIQAELSNINYERSLSVAIVSYTPSTVNTWFGMTLENEQRGNLGIDVLGNQTKFISRENDSTAESKIRHSSGYMSSYYESKIMEQFTGMQAVSTAEVLKRAAEQDIDILYLSKANIEKLDDCNFSIENKEKITNFINEGKYITIPAQNITIDSWSGIGYIVYNPVKDTSAYMLNMLNGGSVCSLVGFAYLAEMITTVVECTWAFEGIMFGVTILGAGLIMAPGLAMAATITLGVGAIFAGFAWVAGIGESFCESTELMTAYVYGDEDAGKKLESKAASHVLLDVAFVNFGMAANDLFAQIHLYRKVGSFFARAFEKTSIGCDGALEILNRVSPKYAEMLTALIDRFGGDFADVVVDKYKTDGIEGVQERINTLKSGPEPGKTPYDNINIDELSSNQPVKLAEIVEDIRINGGSPITIPEDATVISKSMNKGYQQIKYQWSSNTYKYEARWHTETPGAVQYDRGTTWVITRTIPGNAQGQQRITEYLVSKQWINENIWKSAERANIAGTATKEQMEILENGHWQAK